MEVGGKVGESRKVTALMGRENHVGDFVQALFEQRTDAEKVLTAILEWLKHRPELNLHNDEAMARYFEYDETFPAEGITPGMDGYYLREREVR